MLARVAGTGKTLLARAVANRTDACFIRVIGSELVQKYVGEGARMVRELFQVCPLPCQCPSCACIMQKACEGTLAGLGQAAMQAVRILWSAPHMDLNQLANGQETA